MKIVIMIKFRMKMMKKTMKIQKKVIKKKMKIKKRVIQIEMNRKRVIKNKIIIFWMKNKKKELKNYCLINNEI